ncbi:glycosyltransferase [Agrobacterium sp. CG674]
MSLVVVYSPERPLTSVDLAAIDQSFPSSLVAVIGRSSGEPVDGQRISFFEDDTGGLTQFEAFIASMQISAMLFRPHGFWLCARSVLAVVLSKSVPSFFSFDDGVVQGYSFLEAREEISKNVLFIYPGPLAPANNGSRQRALSLFFELISSGENITIAAGKQTLDTSYREFLRQFGVKVIAFEGSTIVQRILKRLRATCKKLLGGGYFLPLFARMEFSLSPSYRSLIDRHSETSGIVVFSYAWMIPFFLKRKNNFEYVVDTHDVNFVRDSGYYIGRGLIGKLLSRFGRYLELRLLSSMDKVAAISTTDYEIFSKTDLKQQIILMPPSFNWIDTVEGTGNAQALTFGFIGADMIANRKAIDHIITDVWPLICKQRPNARLFIAGNICSYVESRNYKLFNITCLGFVASLRGFYTSIDALVSPVLMQGGLNIKIMESLVAGVPVYVNSLGSKSLPRTELVYTAEDIPSGEGIKAFLTLADRFCNNYELRKSSSEDVKRGAVTSFRDGYLRVLAKSKL